MSEAPLNEPLPKDALLTAEGARLVVDGAVAAPALTFSASGPRVLIAGDYLALLRTLAGGAPGEAGSARVAAGTLRLCGRDVSRAEHAALVGVALARAPLPPQWTALELLAWSARLAGRDRRQARALAEAQIERLSLGLVARRALRMLGAAEKRAVAMAQAAVAEPEVLILEDPFEGVDARVVPALFAALAEVTRDRQAIVCLPRLSTSGPEAELLRAASHVIWLRGGELVVDGAPAELLAGMALFAVTVSRNAEALGVELGALGAKVRGGPSHFSVALPENLAARDILAAAARAKAPVLHCVPIA